MLLITCLYAALLALFYVALSINVIRGRVRHKVALLDGGVDDMSQRIRAHANFAEYAPLFLILFGLAEWQNVPDLVLHLVGGMFFLGRVSHAYSLLKAEKYEGAKLKSGLRFRQIGMMMTFTMIIGLALWLLWVVLTQLHAA